MDKYDVITAIGRAFDDRDEAIREVNRLSREIQKRNAEIHLQATVESDGEERDEFALVRANIFQTGKNKVFEDAIGYWHHVSASRNDKGEIEVQSFERWLDRALEKVPSYMSKDQFKSFFSVELESMYESEKAKAVNELRRSEESDDVD